MLKWLIRCGFRVRVADADPENIGMVKFGIVVEDASADEDIIRWSDVALVTGSAFVNGSLNSILPAYKNKCIITELQGPRLLCCLTLKDSA